MNKPICICLLMVTLASIISCRDSYNDNLPKYKILGIEEPRVLPNGSIAFGSGVKYKILISSPLQRDSLELLQDFFIKKSQSDFPGVQKVSVRVFLEGMPSYADPFAVFFSNTERKNITVMGSYKSANFIKEKLEGYKILGCWSCYQEDSYVICQKDGKYYMTNINKEKQSIGELQSINTKVKNGETIYYKPNDKFHEYMIIKDDGLYIYDETGETGTDAVIWVNDPTWKNQ